MDPPPIWRAHLAPYYRRRVAQLQAAGKWVHIHVDGAMKPLLPHLRDCPWDGIEAATPLPQGDVTLDRSRIPGRQGALGWDTGRVLPAHFLRGDARRMRQRRGTTVLPTPGMGISDELPQTA